jgi:hypothetical protein
MTAPASATAEPALIRVAGDLDLASQGWLELRLAAAVAEDRPVVVDLGDCTFADVEAIRTLGRAAALADERRLPFVVVLPFSARDGLRRLLLELVPELAEVAIVPSQRAAHALIARPAPRWASSRKQAPGATELRASVWENAARGERLIAERDALVMEHRRTRKRAQAVRRRLL